MWRCGALGRAVPRRWAGLRRIGLCRYGLCRVGLCRCGLCRVGFGVGRRIGLRTDWVESGGVRSPVYWPGSGGVCSSMMILSPCPSLDLCCAAGVVTEIVLTGLCCRSCRTVGGNANRPPLQPPSLPTAAVRELCGPCRCAVPIPLPIAAHHRPTPPDRPTPPQETSRKVALAVSDRWQSGVVTEGDLEQRTAEPVTSTWTPGYPVDPHRTLMPLRRGAMDPTLRIDGTGIWRTSLTPVGPATLRLIVESRGSVSATAWGAGADWAIAQVPELLGADDDWSGLDSSSHPLLDRTRRAVPGLRIPRTTMVFESLVPAVLEQRVVGADARQSWRQLVTKFGSAAPGPAPDGMRVCPPALEWGRIPSWEWHLAGVDPGRAATVGGGGPGRRRSAADDRRRARRSRGDVGPANGAGHRRVDSGRDRATSARRPGHGQRR